MSLVSTTIPNLVNGVSQQPYALRLASQAEEQINGYSSVVDGLRKRPALKLMKRIFNTPLPNAYIHSINRDVLERYILVITDGDLKVFRIDGTEVAVSFPNGKGYLGVSNAQEFFSCVTVADYTFVLNKAVSVPKDPGVFTPLRPFEAIVAVRQGGYSTTYSVSIDNNVFSHKTADASVAANAELITTDYIALQLFNKLNAALPAAGFLVDVIGSTIYIRRTSQDFVIAVTDGIGDTALKLVKGSVQRFSDLPAKGIPGFKCAISGTNENAFGKYYVEFVAEAGNLYGGTWKETSATGQLVRIARANMPHALRRLPNGTFEFGQVQWSDRSVGDDDSVPFPSFVGQQLNDVFFHRNRLGFLAGENVVFSRSGDPFNFFKASAVTTLDTDPIDVAVSHTKVSILRSAVPFNESLLLFSDQTQFVLAQSEILTPRTTSINQTTEFECNLRAKPVGAGSNVYFSVQRGQYTGVREFYVDGDTQANDAADITAHCPRYLPRGVIKLAASSNEDVLVALSEDKRDSLFVYRYFWSGQDKLQSSWSRWDFGPGTTILSADFLESELFLVVARPDGTFIETLSLEPGRVDGGALIQCHLDQRVDQTNIVNLEYFDAEEKSNLMLPYALQEGVEYQLVVWEGDLYRKPGQVIPFTRNVGGNPNLIQFPGPISKFYFGRKYPLRYRFSTLIIREDAAGGGGMQPVGEGRLQLRNMTVTYAGTGFFKAEVTPAYRSTYRYEFSGRVIGSGQNKIGQIAIEQGTFRFPIASKNDQVVIELVNDTFLPSAFLSAEWEAFFQIRSKRL